jgi:hypothetical protein
MKISEKLKITLAAAGVLAGTFCLVAKDYRYNKQAQVTCPGAGGASAFTQKFDSVYKDPEAPGMVLVAQDHSRITVPANCLVVLKPYARS